MVSHHGFTNTSLMIGDVEYLFIYLMAVHLSSFEKYLLRSFAHFKFGLLIFLLLSCLCSYLSWLLIPHQFTDISSNPWVVSSSVEYFLSSEDRFRLFLVLLPLLLESYLKPMPRIFPSISFLLVILQFRSYT